MRAGCGRIHPCRNGFNLPVVEHVLSARDRAAIAHLVAELCRVGLAVESGVVLHDPGCAGRWRFCNRAVRLGLGRLALIMVQVAAELCLVRPVLVAVWCHSCVRLSRGVELQEPARVCGVLELLAHASEPRQGLDQVTVHKKLCLWVQGLQHRGLLDHQPRRVHWVLVRPNPFHVRPIDVHYPKLREEGGVEWARRVAGHHDRAQGHVVRRRPLRQGGHVVARQRWRGCCCCCGADEQGCCQPPHAGGDELPRAVVSRRARGAARGAKKGKGWWDCRVDNTKFSNNRAGYLVGTL
eukprot:SAG31_NODE_270_length_18732_cov_9.342618_11_plen_295_part_00